MSSQFDSDVKENIENKQKFQTPKNYKVILLNDDYTPMDFVVEVLQRFFGKGQEEAIKIMYDIHHKGTGLCGIYSKSIAETKSEELNKYAEENGHPLTSTISPEEE